MCVKISVLSLVFALLVYYSMLFIFVDSDMQHVSIALLTHATGIATIVSKISQNKSISS